MTTPTELPPEAGSSIGGAGAGTARGEYTTPTKRVAMEASGVAGGSRRPQGASPAYSSRKHSLYGIEDRIVMDPGSRIWKVGFSGEPEPRSVFWATSKQDKEKGKATQIWDLDLDSIFPGDRDEASRIIALRILRNCRDTFNKHLLTDPKSRKLIVIESTFLPCYVKELIAKALFDSLQVPSISFTSASVLSLAACGRVTGLVVDCGWLETTITPVYHSRPLYHFAKSAPVAGRALHARLKALLRRYGIYSPDPSFASSTSQAQGVPEEVLTDELIERVITESCLVGSPIPFSDTTPETLSGEHELTDETEDSQFLSHLREKYIPYYHSKDIQFSLPSSPRNRSGPSTLIVPGWIRERAAEVLFGDTADSEEQSLTELILRLFLLLPLDLRKTFISNILITGGTSSLPGFIPRIRRSLLLALSPPQSAPTPSETSMSPISPPVNTPEYHLSQAEKWKFRHVQPYTSLYPLAKSLAILNDPAPVDGPLEEGWNQGGRSPRWTPSLLSWVGGSLAGALKTGGPELLSEDYDTLVSENYVRGETWSEELRSASEEVAAMVGINVEELEPGMALVGIGNRKWGWREGQVIGDWARGVVA